MFCANGKRPKVQQYPLQVTEIPDRPFDKIAMDLVTECETSTSGNMHILTIIDHLTRWPEAFPIPDKSADTIVATFINEYLPVHMCPQYILSNNGTEIKNSLMDPCNFNACINSLGLIEFSLLPTTPRVMENWKFSTST